MSRIRLGVNVDHVATLREVRKGSYPDPVEAALICEKSGADGIVCHLREDRRHIQERDVQRLLERIHSPLNLEMASSPEIIRIAKRLKPSKVTLVPERRRELTTEGGLDVFSQGKKIGRVIHSFKEKGIAVSLFIDPDRKQLHASYRAGARFLEFHTGSYAHARSSKEVANHLARLQALCREAKEMGLEVAAGHGLHYQNVARVAKISEIEEFNIGHAIISYAVFVGLARAVREMKKLLP